MSFVAVNTENKVDVRPSNPKFVIVLDKSGSMSMISGKILQSVNSLIDEQKALSEKLNDDATLTIITFSTETQTVMKNVPFKNARHLEPEEYYTDGNTALHDAIGIGITQHEGEKNVVFVIVTDGQENSSRLWDRQKVNKAIEAKKDAGWSFIYLANDFRVSEAGDGMGISAAAATSTTSRTNNIAVGYENMAAALSRQISGAFAVYRQSSEVPNLNSPTVPAVPVPVVVPVRGEDVHIPVARGLSRMAVPDEVVHGLDSDSDEDDQNAEVARPVSYCVGNRVATLKRSARLSCPIDGDLLAPNVVRTSSEMDDGDNGNGLDFPMQHPRS